MPLSNIEPWISDIRRQIENDLFFKAFPGRDLRFKITLCTELFLGLSITSVESMAAVDNVGFHSVQTESGRTSVAKHLDFYDVKLAGGRPVTECLYLSNPA